MTIENDSRVIQYDELLERCMGNQAFAQRVLDRFRERFADDLEELERQLNSGDAMQASKLAHRLKGAAANVSAESLSQLAADIEACSRQGQLEQAESPLRELLDSWPRVTAEIAEVCDGQC